MRPLHCVLTSLARLLVIRSLPTFVSYYVRLRHLHVLLHGRVRYHKPEPPDPTFYPGPGCLRETSLLTLKADLSPTQPLLCKDSLSLILLQDERGSSISERHSNVLAAPRRHGTAASAGPALSLQDGQDFGRGILQRGQRMCVLSCAWLSYVRQIG